MKDAMTGRLDEISRAIGAIETSVAELQLRADEDREIRDRWHAESREAIAALTRKLDQHAATVEMMRPAVAAFEVSRSKLAAWASLGFAGLVVLGWIVEASVKWAIEQAWSSLH
jgi:hypothetical protein